MNDLSQRLRELSDVLIGCEWEVPLCASEDCIKAANEINRLRGERTYWRHAYSEAQDELVELRERFAKAAGGE